MFVRRSPAIVLGLVLSAAALVPAPAVASDGGAAEGVPAPVVAAAGSASSTSDGAGLVPTLSADGTAAKRRKDTQNSFWGNCQDGSRVKLRTTMMTNGEIEVVGVVFSDDDDVWSWRFKHNDDLSFMGEVRAKDADRSLRIVRFMVDLYGPDVVLFRAVNQKTGEACKVEGTA
ncbi:hypothetical protein GGQ22_05390 [Nocardioides sp. zg-579]|uniref:Uncharacterized protein n=1 Tax=Nocardioides marmotae TaxID=2663857 RepID=A0A6I3J9I8_9ACTN|nr:hypothetical protein [Nocardioides marmotae]MCR6030873.1 hypothetical protein [Gordonia jinghuaiqii]MTB94510.1 hypothetical protein [Nocardioides marmotae]QKE01473.1 hypothetical protein HPC71_10595 [Nocardioides marmotae]